ncbi:MAG: hypothetical protein VW866_04575 [Hyphomicrobiales bacterium]
MNVKRIYAFSSVTGVIMAMYDHLTSPVLALASPGQSENSCAPCGAPCLEKD